MKQHLLILVFLLAISQIHCSHSPKKSAEQWVTSAYEKIKNKDNEGAIADLDEAIELNPKYVNALYIRGLVKFELGRKANAKADFDQAIVVYSQDIAHAPKDAKLYFGRGETEAELKRDTDAVADYNKAIALNPKYTDAYENRAKLELNSSAWSAIIDFSRAIALNPKDANAYNWRGYIYYRLGKIYNTKGFYQHAIADYDMSVQTGGKSYEPIFEYRDDAVKTVNLMDEMGSQ